MGGGPLPGPQGVCIIACMKNQRGAADGHNILPLPYYLLPIAFAISCSLALPQAALVG